MKVYSIEVLVLDFDDIGEDEVKSVIENTRYPNRCIAPEVKGIITKEIEWSDEHPLNLISESDRAYREIFNIDTQD